MTAFQQFVLILVLGTLGIFELAGAWHRFLEYRLKRVFMKDQREHLQSKIDDKVNEFFKMGKTPDKEE